MRTPQSLITGSMKERLEARVRAHSIGPGFGVDVRDGIGTFSEGFLHVIQGDFDIARNTWTPLSGPGGTYCVLPITEFAEHCASFLRAPGLRVHVGEHGQARC